MCSYTRFYLFYIFFLLLLSWVFFVVLSLFLNRTRSFSIGWCRSTLMLPLLILLVAALFRSPSMAVFVPSLFPSRSPEAWIFSIFRSVAFWCSLFSLSLSQRVYFALVEVYCCRSVYIHVRTHIFARVSLIYEILSPLALYDVYKYMRINEHCWVFGIKLLFYIFLFAYTFRSVICTQPTKLTNSIWPTRAHHFFNKYKKHYVNCFSLDVVCKFWSIWVVDPLVAVIFHWNQ